MINPEPLPADAELEARIDRERLALLLAQTPAEQRAAWAEFTRLINMRSPQRVEQMERERGLR